MRVPIAALLACLLLSALAAAPAPAAPVEVEVRIEGKSRTLFEGPILSDTHLVRDANDSQWRRCDGTVGAGPLAVPGITPTSASSDAMRIIGEDFDGIWHGQWGDYFVERWGPDAQEAGFKYWGVIVNNVFTPVGGCQDQLDSGDEVLWVFDAFTSRPRLLLYPGDYSGGALPPTATATLGEPFAVEVNAWTSGGQGTPPPAPTRSTTLYDGAEVAPVTTDVEKGFQSVDVASAETELTGADGRASITFNETGWHRIKATDFDAGVEQVIRSNRLDVCVPEPPATECDTPPPADALLRLPPPPRPGELGEGSGGGGDDGGGGPGDQGANPSTADPSATGPPAAPAGRLRLSRPRLDRSRLSRGMVRVSWRLLDAGPGVGRWSVVAKPLGRKGARWTSRAGGRRGSAATIRLAAGASYALRLTVTDTLGRSANVALGRVTVPARDGR